MKEQFLRGRCRFKARSSLTIVRWKSARKKAKLSFLGVTRTSTALYHLQPVPKHETSPHLKIQFPETLCGVISGAEQAHL